MHQRIISLSAFLPWAKVGIIIIMHFHAPHFTVLLGGNSIFPVISSGYSKNSASSNMCIASRKIFSKTNSSRNNPMPHRNVGHCFYNIFPSCSNCSSSEAETRILCVYVPLGFARGTDLGFARGALGFARGAITAAPSG